MFSARFLPVLDDRGGGCRYAAPVFLALKSESSHVSKVRALTYARMHRNLLFYAIPALVVICFEE